MKHYFIVQFQMIKLRSISLPNFKQQFPVSHPNFYKLFPCHRASTTSQQFQPFLNQRNKLGHLLSRPRTLKLVKQEIAQNEKEGLLGIFWKKQLLNDKSEMKGIRFLNWVKRKCKHVQKSFRERLLFREIKNDMHPFYSSQKYDSFRYPRTRGVFISTDMKRPCNQQPRSTRKQIQSNYSLDKRHSSTKKPKRRPTKMNLDKSRVKNEKDRLELKIHSDVEQNFKHFGIKLQILRNRASHLKASI